MAECASTLKLQKKKKNSGTWACGGNAHQYQFWFSWFKLYLINEIEFDFFKLNINLMIKPF